MFSSKNKICMLGEGGVGKTSLVSLLQGKEILKKRDPTVGLEIDDTMLNGCSKVAIWDLGGQERFRFLWKDFLKGSGLSVLVTDSTEENVKKTKEIYERFSNHIGSKVIAIANKQDLPGALSAEDVQKKLGIKTYEMCALRKELQSKLKKILENEIS
ncbi:MAG: Small GTP-binding domain protein [Promethearchaeota archaeon]|nr:MAG: Small GTP-binding domain protein [Candidatus Lokiarchaeota archaeon]